MWWRYKSGEPRRHVLEDRDTLYSLGLVAILLLAVISYNNMKAKEEAQRSPARDEEEDAAGWLSKFAVQGGNVVGETVGMDGDRLVLKQAGTYKVIPLAAAKLHGDEVHVVDDVDWTQALADGAAWHEANTKGLDDAVTSQLTRSQDVKAPALAALEARDEEE